MLSIKTIQTALLEIAYLDEGPANGPVVILLHGWPDDLRGWRTVIPLLNQAGFRTIAPYLRGFGATRFLHEDTIRDGRGIALAQDAIDLADALHIDRFYVVGHDWGARTAYMLGGLFPERIQRIAGLALAFQPHAVFSMPSFDQARLFWYQWLMYVEAEAEAIRRDPVGFARIQWDTWSPAGWYEEKEFLETARSFTSPDWVPITLHGYRSRFAVGKIDPRYDVLAQRMSTIAQLNIPTLVIIGAQDTCDKPADSGNMEDCFTSGYRRILLEGVGHFPPREAPKAVVQALVEVFWINFFQECT